MVDLFQTPYGTKLNCFSEREHFLAYLAEPSGAILFSLLTMLKSFSRQAGVVGMLNFRQVLPGTS